MKHTPLLFRHKHVRLRTKHVTSVKEWPIYGGRAPRGNFVTVLSNQDIYYAHTRKKYPNLSNSIL